ncbi:sensor histidine kinase [Arvimicrobium flavum]|uniref:sensor histidine kinase n=1 Tax=Arvimicrobium flavum TaxID=3393320 RepID=UPI00237BF077|nr:sensor histidine kinase [Mesorhizobium shangrilense]
MLYQDVAGNEMWSLNVPSPWSRNPFSGTEDSKLLGPEGRRQLADARTGVLTTGEQQAVELQLRTNDGVRCFVVWIDADRDEQNRTVGLVTTSVETTDQRRREQTLRALLREVSHRSKNLLAIILSIASQTSRYSETIDTFVARFRGRIQSLASSQDLVTLSNWRGADLQQLAKNQVGRYCTDPRQNIRMKGESPYLNPNATLYIGLALHELAVNSVSYGALAHLDGHIDIEVVLAHKGERSGLEIIWKERISPARPADEKRFGSVALERVVPAALDGSATLDLASGRVSYRLFVPEANYEIV